MPQVTVYIRNEDLPLWKNLENKSQAISDFLNKKNSLAKANTSEWTEVSNGVSSNDVATDSVIQCFYEN